MSLSAFDFDVHQVVGLPIMSTAPATNPSWQARYEELLVWRATHGDTCVPKAEGALGRWVARQRELKRSGKLDPGREQALNSICFVWNTVTAMWDERFRRLSEWKSIHGHCAVPIAQGELGTWVSKQRQLRKRQKLSQEKVDALNSLGFTWSTAEADWEDKFKRLCEWAKERGHASVPFNEGELGWWVNTQRQCKRKGKLSLAREERLCSLGFVWNPSNSRNKAVGNAVLEASSASSLDNTPGTTPEKYDDINAPAADAMQLINIDHNPLQYQHHHQHMYDHQPPIPEDMAVHYGFQNGPQSPDMPVAENPPQLQTEGPLSPIQASLSQGLWSPIEMTSPILPSSFFSGMTSIYGQTGLLLQLQPSVQQQQAMVPFSQAASMQNHSDALEQLLSGSDPPADPDPCA